MSGALVQLWQWDLDAPGAGGAEDRAILSKDERARADRYVVAHAARRFVAGRAAVRRTMAAQCGRDAAALLLRAGETGKPFLAGGPHFSLSHSGSIALFTVADCPVGVDVERMRDIEAGVAALVFDPNEQAYLQELPDAQRRDAFFRGWTRKEAVIKARGGSIADIVSVVALPRHVFTGWEVIDLAAPPGYRAALAIPCRGCTIISGKTETDAP